MSIESAEFSHNEAWLLFQLNDAPVQTASDGDFNAFAIMEVASGMIFGMELVQIAESEISETQSRQLLASAEKQAGSRPRRLFVEAGREAGMLSDVATSMDIHIERVSADDLAPITQEARQGFAEHVSGSRTH